MKPVFCQVKHDPPNTYGDCVRACVASILNLHAFEVPHFFEDDCSGEIGYERIRAFAATRGLSLIWFAYVDEISLNELITGWNNMNPHVPAILLAGTANGDHAVIVQDGEIIHNPAWSGGKIDRPNSNGHWNILLFAVAS